MPRATCGLHTRRSHREGAQEAIHRRTTSPARAQGAAPGREHVTPCLDVGYTHGFSERGATRRCARCAHPCGRRVTSWRRHHPNGPRCARCVPSGQLYEYSRARAPRLTDRADLSQRLAVAPHARQTAACKLVTEDVVLAARRRPGPRRTSSETSQLPSKPPPPWRAATTPNQMTPCPARSRGGWQGPRSSQVLSSARPPRKGALLLRGAKSTGPIRLPEGQVPCARRRLGVPFGLATWPTPLRRAAPNVSGLFPLACAAWPRGGAPWRSKR